MYCLDNSNDRNEVILMPRYDYRCEECKAMQVIVHDFHSTDEQICPACKGKMVKVISVTPVHFKGSGFYKTDYK